MIRGVIFDVDGVLLDSMIIWRDLGARYLERMGIASEEGLKEILFSMSMEQGAEYLKEHYSIDSSAEEILDDLKDLLEHFYFEEVKAKPGASELMELLKTKGIRITAATSSPRTHIERALERNGISGPVEKLYTTSEIGESKHSPVIYNMAAGYMGTLPEETVVFEDSLYALKTAKNAGYRTVGMYDGNGESDQEGLKREADIYLKELVGFKEHIN